MIQKYVYGTPFDTESVVENIPAAAGAPAYGAINIEKGFSFSFSMESGDIVYGLGEANRGINKRGYLYTSNCTDDNMHTEGKVSLYAAHNFILVSNTARSFGMYFDYPSVITFDIGYTKSDLMTVTCDEADLTLYVIDGKDPLDIVKQFRKIIGQSYIPRNTRSDSARAAGAM